LRANQAFYFGVENNMRVRKISILVMIISVLSGVELLSQTSSVGTNPALTNPAMRNPVGQGNMPVTTYQSGLVRSPNPIDNTADLVMSGNIGGGRHFRGVLPYNATTDFAGNIPSGSLDYFNRYSSISDNYYRGGATPYYSSSTVTRMDPLTNSVMVPPSPRIRGVGLDSISDLQAGGAQQTSAVDLRIASMGRGRFINMPTSWKMQMLAEQEQTQENINLLQQQNQQHYEQLSRELRQVSQKVEDLQKNLDVELRSYDPQALRVEPVPMDASLPEYFSSETIKQKDTQEKDTDTPSTQTRQPDIYSQMMQEYQQLNQAYEETFGMTIEERAQEQTGTDQSLPEEERRLRYSRSTTGSARPSQSPVSEQRSVEGQMLEAEARVVLEEHKTFASFAEDRFNRSMRAAEEYMKEGKFYLAADAYTLASIYKPEDPLAFAGKSHALFAAGEYISSALYLAKSIEMFPEYVNFKIDIVSMIGNVDTVEKRITDINEWLKISGAPELNFLLAYVYMQLDRLPRAQEAITAAYDGMPEFAPVEILKNAINQRAGK